MKMCVKCGNQMRDDVDVCPHCDNGANTSNPMNNETPHNTIEKVDKGVRIVKAIPVLLIGGVVIFFSVLGAIIDFFNSNKYDSQTTGSFVEFANCEEYDSEEGDCDAIYAYEVDGEIYNTEDLFVTDDYSEVVTISYNSKDPNVAMVGDVSGGDLNMYGVITGIFIIFIGIISIKNKNVNINKNNR